MVAEIGLEPTTCRVWTGCSSQLSYSAEKLKNGGAKGDRTPDPLRARQVLSQLSYDPTNNGRNDRIWTCNPLVPNQMHCQVVLHSVHKCLNIIPNGREYFNTFFHFFKSIIFGGSCRTRTGDHWVAVNCLTNLAKEPAFTLYHTFFLLTTLDIIFFYLF